MSNSRLTLEQVITHNRRVEAERLQRKSNDKTILAGSSPVVQELKTGCAPGQATNPDDQGSLPDKNAKHDPRLRRAITAHFYYSDRYNRDLDGALSTVLDCLVQAKAIPDDNRFIVHELHAYAYDCAKGDDRVDVEIEEVK